MSYLYSTPPLRNTQRQTNLDDQQPSGKLRGREIFDESELDSPNTLSGVFNRVPKFQKRDRSHIQTSPETSSVLKKLRTEPSSDNLQDDDDEIYAEDSKPLNHRITRTPHPLFRHSNASEANYSEDENSDDDNSEDVDSVKTGGMSRLHRLLPISSPLFNNESSSVKRIYCQDPEDLYPEDAAIELQPLPPKINQIPAIPVSSKKPTSRNPLALLDKSILDRKERQTASIDTGSDEEYVLDYDES